jgi:hypothetical protein
VTDAFLRFQRIKQVVKSAVKRCLGQPQPSLLEIRSARVRVEGGKAGLLDGGDPGRDHCLARGFCCERGCRACPWGYRKR